MRMWIDADACPGPVRDIVIKASQRLEIATVFVANRPMFLQGSAFVSTVQVAKGLDVADQHISAHAEKGDLAVTQDIPLAAVLVRCGVVVLDPRGEVFTEENVEERLSMRNFVQELRESGVSTGGPSGFSAQDRQRFAASLDRELSRLVKRA